MLSLLQVRDFVVLAETLHFGQAAERLGVTQPALSRAIKSLEEKMGTQLFVRTSREVALTADGERHLLDAREIVAASERMLGSAPSARGSEQGVLSIGYVPFAEEVAEELMQPFSTLYPEVRIVQRREFQQALHRGLDDGELDLGLILAEPQPHPGLREQFLCEVPMRGLVGPDHPLARRATVSPREVAEYPLPYAMTRPAGLLVRVLAPSFARYGLSPEWCEVHDPLGPRPALLTGTSDHVWLTPSRRQEADQVEIDPPILCPLNLAYRSDRPNPVREAFVRHCSC